MTNNVKLGTLICQLEQLSFFFFFSMSASKYVASDPVMVYDG